MPKAAKYEIAPLDVAVSEYQGQASAYWINAKDGLKLRVAHLPSPEQTKGTIFLFQGRTENIEKYGRAAVTFNELGYAVFAIDWRGQGLSDRLADDPRLGHITDYSDYQLDVQAMINAAYDIALPKPWFLVGHSLGACIGLRALIEGIEVSAAAFTAPLWDINLPPLQKRLAWPLSWGAQLIGKGEAYSPKTNDQAYVLVTPFDENRLTHDPEMYAYYQSITKALPNQVVAGPSLGWLHQTLKETKRLASRRSPKVPCVTFFGELDEIVAVGAIKDRMSRWSSGDLTIVPNARHDVLCERPDIRKKVFAQIDDLFSAAK